MSSLCSLSAAADIHGSDGTSCLRGIGLFAGIFRIASKGLSINYVVGTSVAVNAC